MSLPFDPDREVRNAIGESYRDGKVATVTARDEQELSWLETAARQLAEAEGGGFTRPPGRIGYWHGAPGNEWMVRVELDC